MIYQCVKEVENQISVSGVLNILNISTSGYYHFKKRDVSNQSIKRKRIKQDIQKAYDDSYQIYGAPKITKIWFFNNIVGKIILLL